MASLVEKFNRYVCVCIGINDFDLNYVSLELMWLAKQLSADVL